MLHGIHHRLAAFAGLQALAQGPKDGIERLPHAPIVFQGTRDEAWPGVAASLHLLRTPGRSPVGGKGARGRRICDCDIKPHILIQEPDVKPCLSRPGSNVVLRPQRQAVCPSTPRSDVPSNPSASYAWQSSRLRRAAKPWRPAEAVHHIVGTLLFYARRLFLASRCPRAGSSSMQFVPHRQQHSGSPSSAPCFMLHFAGRRMKKAASLVSERNARRCLHI
jgi:hypothetical protein